MKISMRFVSVTASVLALATLTACVAPAPVYQTSRYPYQPPPQAVPYREAAYVEYGHVANIEVLRSGPPALAPPVAVPWPAASSAAWWATSSAVATAARRPPRSA